MCVCEYTFRLLRNWCTSPCTWPMWLLNVNYILGTYVVHIHFSFSCSDSDSFFLNWIASWLAHSRSFACLLVVCLFVWLLKICPFSDGTCNISIQKREQEQECTRLSLIEWLFGDVYDNCYWQYSELFIFPEFFCMCVSVFVLLRILTLSICSV